MTGSHEILSFAGRSAAGPQHPPGLLGEGDPWYTPASLSFEGIQISIFSTFFYYFNLKKLLKHKFSLFLWLK
jgi:hypothetical protein